jgi:non-specific serine/threonine protein kinase
MSSSLWFFWNSSGLLQDGRQWLARALDADRQPSPERAKALWVIGWYAMIQGDNATAKEYLQECSTLAESIDDRSAQAFAFQFRGTAEQIDGNLHVALELLNAAMVHHAGAGKVNCLTILGGAQLGFANCLLGNLQEALAFADEAITLGKYHGERFATSWALWVRGLALWTQHEHRRATDSLKESIELKQSLKVTHSALPDYWVSVGGCAAKWAVRHSSAVRRWSLRAPATRNGLINYSAIRCSRRNFDPVRISNMATRLSSRCRRE